jgi:hypothetical protein
VKTLLLDQTAWDLVLDAQGNIAVAAEPYALAQDAASEIRTFEGEVYYDQARGVPYFGQILGKFPPAQLMKAVFVKAAMSVPGVKSANCFLAAVRGRVVTGQVQITSTGGERVALTAPVAPPGLVPQNLPGGFDFSDPRQSAWPFL